METSHLKPPRRGLSPRRTFCILLHVTLLVERQNFEYTRIRKESLKLLRSVRNTNYLNKEGLINSTT